MADSASRAIMRLTLLVATALVVLASVAPTAQAARAQLVLAPPEGAVQADAVVPVEIALALSGFMCPEDESFTVMLATNASAGVTAAWEQDALVFVVPAGTYFAEGYQGATTANLSVAATASGQVDLMASFIPEPGACFVPDGFDPAETTVALRVDAPAGEPAPPPTNETTPEANLTSEETNATETNTTNATTRTPEQPRTAPDGVVCPPEGSCGLIGEYERGGSEESSSPVPATALPLAAGVLALAALVARRRKP